MRRWIVAATTAAVLVAGCGGSKSDEEQIRETMTGFLDSIVDGKNDCMKYVAEDSRAAMAVVGGCQGLHELFAAAGDEAAKEASNLDMDDFRIKVTGNTATLTDVTDKESGTPDKFVKEDGQWRFALDT